MDIAHKTYVYYIYNQPNIARKHFHALREAKPDLVGFYLLDRIDNDELQTRLGFRGHVWHRREIENYIAPTKQVLIDWARAKALEYTGGPLFSESWVSTMEERVTEIEKARATLRQESPWSPDIKVTDDFLDGLFETFFEKLGISNSMRKANYYSLVKYLPLDQIDPEVTQVLDAILEVANKAVPLSSSM